MSRKVAVLVALLCAAAPSRTGAHAVNQAHITGYVATVSAVEPNVVGVQVRVVLGDQLQLTNYTKAPVEILGPDGRPERTINAGRTLSWHDERIVETGDPPPPPRSGGAPTTPRFVKNWRVPGRTAEREFAINGFVGWIPPAPQPTGDEGPPLWAFALGGFGLVALSAGAVYVLSRRPD